MRHLRIVSGWSHERHLGASSWLDPMISDDLAKALDGLDMIV